MFLTSSAVIVVGGFLCFQQSQASKHPTSGPFVPFTMKHEYSMDRSLQLQLNSPSGSPEKKQMKGRHFSEGSSLTVGNALIVST
jgi:hypothetical protein